MVQKRASAPRVVWRALSGSAVVAGEITVTPQSRVLVLRLPRGIVVWQRPSAVLVEQAGQTTRLPIRDATRLVQCALLGGGVFLARVGWLATPQRKERAS